MRMGEASANFINPTHLQDVYLTARTDDATLVEGGNELMRVRKVFCSIWHRLQRFDYWPAMWYTST